MSDLQTDRGTQTRASIRAAKVREYAELMKRGRKFPPIEVCRVGKELWLVDGFHRVGAAKQCGLTTLEAEVFDGTRSEAIRASLMANQSHGLPRSAADKRAWVKQALSEYPNYGSRKIAEMGCVSHELVARIKRQLSTNDSCSAQKTLGLDGKWRKMPRPKSEAGARTGAPANASAKQGRETTETPDADNNRVSSHSRPDEAIGGDAPPQAGKNKSASGTFDNAKSLERILKLMYEEVRNCAPKQLVDLHRRVIFAANHVFTWPGTVSDLAALVKIAQQGEECYQATITKVGATKTQGDSPPRSIGPNPADNERGLKTL